MQQRQFLPRKRLYIIVDIDIWGMEVMKNLFVVLMNVLFLLVVAADVVSVKYECNAAPTVQKSCYQERQAHFQAPVDMISLNVQ